MIQKEVVQYVLEQYGITDLEVDIDDFNSKVDAMVSESLERGGPLYEGIAPYVMGAEAELIHELIETHNKQVKE